MNLTHIGAMTALILAAAHAKGATAVNSVEVLDARIADAKVSAKAAQKAADTICRNMGYAIGQRELGLSSNAHETIGQCTDATRASSDAIGFVGLLYEQRSQLTGQPMPSRVRVQWQT